MTRPFDSCTVHIIGLGLMGGSLAMALRGQVHRLTAEDIDPDVIQQALHTGVIDATGTPAGADIVILAIPADRIVPLIAGLELPPGALVVDLGSTKARICAQLDQLPDNVLAVGGHPMCGLAENGFRHATGKLYQGARFVLCETARTTGDARALAEALVLAVGAEPLWIEAARQDALTALTSHLPHLLSFALMRLAMDVAQDDEALYELAAGGFDGATRLARTEASMIVGMFSTNSGPLREALASLRAHLDHLEAILDDTPGLQNELSAIVAARRTYTAVYGERLIT